MSHPTADSLPLGDVLVVGTVAGIYAPKEARWIPMPSPLTPRDGHVSARVSMTEVLIAGGNAPSAPTAAAELFVGSCQP
jgi:hypothetical protein